ncbi:MAG: hypothetical protein Q4C56_04070 [Peptococcaceae bacterium]|nr:hypothetical protein [Peptococcaceae bacterium]
MEEKKTKDAVTGLESAANRKDAEYDLVNALLSAMDYQQAEENITEVEIRRHGVFYFAVHLHPLSDEQIRIARKKATTYQPNPNGKKLPPIEREINNAKLKSWVIYLATVEADQQKIWGNAAVKDKAGLIENWETIDALLTAGEKNRLFEVVLDVSGLDDDLNSEDMSEEEYAKN